MEDEIFDDLKSNFENTYGALRRELARVRGGRANVNILDNIRVSYYGQPTPLNQVASVQVPEPRVIIIKPWEKNLLADLEKAIHQANLGINPANDGTVIRLAIPPLTEDRRKELVRTVHQHGENARVSIRNNRRDANALLKALQKDGDLTEDDLAKSLKTVQEHTDAATTTVDRIVGEKEQDLMEV